jgi:hypothetical protein
VAHIVGFALTNTDDDMMVFDEWYDDYDYDRRYSPNVSALSFEHQCKYIRRKFRSQTSDNMER